MSDRKEVVRMKKNNFLIYFLSFIIPVIISALAYLNIKILNENQMLEITTPHFRLKLNKQTGNLDSIYDFELQRELLQNGGNGNGLISLDDFGVGYSSLNYLRTLPLDVVKLDKSFVQSILVNKQDQRLTEGILKLASSLNLHVVAEVVESKKHME